MEETLILAVCPSAWPLCNIEIIDVMASAYENINIKSSVKDEKRK